MKKEHKCPFCGEMFKEETGWGEKEDNENLACRMIHVYRHIHEAHYSYYATEPTRTWTCACGKAFHPDNGDGLQKLHNHVQGLSKKELEQHIILCQMNRAFLE